MSEPFIGEIRLFANDYPPRGWALCNGQILQINGNQALYSLLGATYGGDGVTNFALPDLRGRVPIHVASSFKLGAAGGEATHTLTSQEMPMHNHQVKASSNQANAVSPNNNVWAVTGQEIYGPAVAQTKMNSGAISTAGASQAHNNMQPYLAVNYCIALEGIFPSRS